MRRQPRCCNPGGPGVAGTDRVAGCRGSAQRGDRPADRDQPTDGGGRRARYVAGGIATLHDQPRSGRPPEIDEIDVVVATLAEAGRPPTRVGVTHWSARLLAAELKISFATVARIWRKWRLQL